MEDLYSGIDRRDSPFAIQLTLLIEEVTKLAAEQKDMAKSITLLTAAAQKSETILAEVIVVKNSVNFAWKFFMGLGAALPSLYLIYTFAKNFFKEH